MNKSIYSVKTTGANSSRNITTFCTQHKVLSPQYAVWTGAYTGD